MLSQTASVLVSLAAVLTFELAGSCFLFFTQMSAIAGPTILWFALVSALQRVQRRTVNHGATMLRYRRLVWKAARKRRIGGVVQGRKSRFGHRAPSLDCHGAVRDGTLDDGTDVGGFGEGGALATIDAIRGVDRA